MPLLIDISTLQAILKVEPVAEAMIARINHAGTKRLSTTILRIRLLSERQNGEASQSINLVDGLSNGLTLTDPTPPPGAPAAHRSSSQPAGRPRRAPGRVSPS